MTNADPTPGALPGTAMLACKASSDNATAPGGGATPGAKAPSEGQPASWMAVRFGHMGDVVLTTGVLAWLGRTRGWTFDCLVGVGLSPIFEEHPFVRNILSLDTRCGAIPLTRVFRELAQSRKGWGLLDLHGSLRSRLLAGMWQGPVARYRKMALARRVFLAGKGRWFGPALRGLTVPQRYALAIAGETPPAAELLPRIWLREEEKNRATGQLADCFGLETRPVALHPYATHSLKAWPERHFRALVAALDARSIPWICVGKGENFFPGRKEDFTNKTSLRETCALLERCRALVTGDSGPMHLAAAVGTPVLALFGPTTREWGFYPAGPQDRVLELELDCRPCSLHGKRPCGKGGACLAEITPEMILSALEELL